MLHANMLSPPLQLLFVALLLVRDVSSSSTSGSGQQQRAGGSVLVVGSANVDTFLPVKRLPVEGENLTVPPGRAVEIDVPGGKGCNQAVAAARLLCHGGVDGASPVAFLGQFGNDAAATILKAALTDANVDTSACGTCHHAPSGRGYVFLQEDSGRVSAVVLGGSNVEGWKGWEEQKESSSGASAITDQYLDALLSGKSCVLLQREVPEFVNLRIAKRAKELGVVVLQDVGGEDRPMDEAMMRLCDYIIPNASELNRLCKSLDKDCIVKDTTEYQEDKDINEVIERAKLLQKHGARNVLVTLGSRGSVLVPEDGGEAIVQDSCRLPSHLSVVDETGAGDCFRAAFAVARASEKRPIPEAMQIASAAGALAVTRKGAVPSIPDRTDVDALCRKSFGAAPITVPRGGDESPNCQGNDIVECPHMFGSRLNSMKDRPDLHEGELSDVRHWVQRQRKIRGLGCVDFNYPQHFHSWTNADAKAALDEVGLVAGAVCLRYPSKFARGAMNNPDACLRREAIDLTKEAAQAARELGCNEVVVWSAYDGYDYPFQVDYHEKWKQLVDAFRECCDAYPDIKFSLEFKPTDENTRFFTVPSTGAALLLVKEIDRPNMGLTLDMGHMLMAGENPGQSIAMVGDKLYGIQLNDGYTRLAAEDGMMFGSVHPTMALEAIYQLQQIKGGFQGHLYFDTFPQRTDPVAECEFNIQRVKDFWRAASRMNRSALRRIMDEHDAIGALNMIDEVLRR